MSMTNRRCPIHNFRHSLLATPFEDVGMAERVIWLMIRVRRSISRPGARAVVTAAPAHAVLRHVDWVRGHDGCRAIDLHIALAAQSALSHSPLSARDRFGDQ
jgi:hypothetical protein